MERAYLQALSVVVGTELRYVAIVVTSARHLDARTLSYCEEQRHDVAWGQQKGKTRAQQGETRGLEDADFDAAVMSELTRPYYLCIGKHSLSILDSKMIGNSEGGRGGYLATVPFRALHQVKVCTTEANGFSIEIDPALAQIPPHCKLPPSIYMRSGSVERIVQQLRICWKSDFMYRTLTVRDLDVWNGPSLLESVSKDISEDCIPSSWITDAGSLSIRGGFAARAPVPDLKRLETQSYIFFAPKQFVLRGRKQSGYFVRGREEAGTSGEVLIVREAKITNKNTSINKSATTSGSTADIYDHYSPKHVAEHYVRTEISPRVRKFRYLSRPRALIKRGNTSGDPASWDGWMIVLRVGYGFGLSGNSMNQHEHQVGEDDSVGSEDDNSRDGTNNHEPGKKAETLSMFENRDIVVIAARRSFIPPSMDMSQDIVIVHLCKKNIVASLNRGVITAQCVFDTLAPKSRDFNYDRIVVQTKADALLLSNAEYSCFAFQHDIKPENAWNRGRQFCLCILKLLENANVITVSSHPEVQRMFDGITVPRGHEDPFEYASLLEKEADGLPHDVPMHFAESWRRRAWHFLSWCVDGGVVPSALTIEKLVSNHGLLIGQPKVQMKIAQIIDSLLYMHAPGEAFSKSNLLAKVQDDMLMRSFTFNENIMCRLIETGYLKSALIVRGDKGVYPRFLVLTNAVAVLSNLAQDSRLRTKIIGALGFEPDSAGQLRSPYDSKGVRMSSGNTWSATRSVNSIPAVYIVLTDLLKPDAPLGIRASIKYPSKSTNSMNASFSIENDDKSDDSGSGTIDASGALSMIHFRVIQTLKNLAVRVPSAATSTNEANKRSMRFALPLIIGFLDAVGDEHIIHIVLELIYVLCFDPILRRDLFNEYNLDLKIRDIFTSEADSLKKIISDLRRLKQQLDNVG
eukprot:g4281.t1